MKAGAEEEGLQFAIRSGNKDRITKSIEALPAPPKTAMKMVEGDWQEGVVFFVKGLWVGRFCGKTQQICF